MRKPKRIPASVPSLARYLEGCDVRAILQGALDGKTFWVLFGPGYQHDYRVQNFVLKPGGWTKDGDTISAGDSESDGWEMLGALFVRAFTQP